MPKPAVPVPARIALPAFDPMLSPTQLRQLGLLTVAWAEIDELMKDCALHLLKVDVRTAEAIMGSTTLEPKIKILDAIFAARASPENQEIWRACSSDIGNESKHRNHFIHSVFELHAYTNTLKARRVRNSKQTVDVAELGNHLEQACVLSIRLADLRWRLLFPEPSPWRENAPHLFGGG